MKENQVRGYFFSEGSFSLFQLVSTRSHVEVKIISPTLILYKPKLKLLFREKPFSNKFALKYEKHFVGQCPVFECTDGVMHSQGK
jgi:hypothetical protein